MKSCVGKKEKKYKVFRYEAKSIHEWKSEVQPEIKRRKFGTKETCDELSEICFFNNLHSPDPENGVQTRPTTYFDANNHGNDLGKINLHLCKEHLPDGLLDGDSDVKTLLIQRKAAKREVERFFREIKNLKKAKETDVKITKKKYKDAKRKEEKIKSKAKEELNYYKNVLEKSKKKKKKLENKLKQLQYLKEFKKRLIENDIINDTPPTAPSANFGFGARRRVEAPEKCKDVLKEYKDRINDLIRNKNDIHYFIQNYIPTKKLYHVAALSCHPDKHKGEEEEFDKIYKEIEDLKEIFSKEFDDDYHKIIGQRQIIPSSVNVTDIVKYKAYPKEKEGEEPIEYHVSPEILEQFKTPTPPPYDWKKVDLKTQGQYEPAKPGEIFVTPKLTREDVNKLIPGTPTDYDTDTTLVTSPVSLRRRKRLPLHRPSSETDSKRIKISDTYDKKLFNEILPRVPGEPPILYKYFFKSDTRKKYEDIVKAILRYPKNERKTFRLYICYGW